MEFDRWEENFFGTASQSDSENRSDDSDEDPTYSTIKESQTKFSNLSIKKKTKARICDDIDIPFEEDSNGSDNDPSELDEKDVKILEEIQRKIGAGQLEKLKVDQCKVYLRKNGLRLTGNKTTLLQRIKEHLEILNGEGDKKYPVSSFVMNCKGDACTGDVVLFEQNVYDMFNVASRSATGPPCGTRMVAGRIVKESYGAAKQQHTFTIEVLWSKGEKPLPPLHPLLIKGRNLYRLKTLRQKWENEEKRRNILMEKHSRGSLARSDREARIQEKKNKKMLNGNRISKKEAGRSQPPQLNSTLMPKAAIQNLGNKEKESRLLTDCRKSTAATKAQETSLTANFTKLAVQPLVSIVGCAKGITPSLVLNNRRQDKHDVHHGSDRGHVHREGSNGSNSYLNYCPPTYACSSMSQTKELLNRGSCRQPLTSMENRTDNQHLMGPSMRQNRLDNYHPMGPPRRQNGMQQKLCRYYAQGRCNYGDTCTFSHDMRADFGQRREERRPCDLGEFQRSHDPREFQRWQ